MDYIFDTHAHYDDEAFDADREEVLTGLKEQGIGTVVNVGASIASTKTTLALAEAHPFMYAAVGVHPNETAELTDADMKWLESLAENPKVVAIGEIGLDYYWDEPEREIQKHWFSAQLAIAKKTGLPVIIHSRDAAQETYDLLEKYRPRGVVHCYSGSAEMAQEILKLGMYIGFTGVVTFKNAKKAVKAAAAVPMDRLLIETDCPYMAPEPTRGVRCDSSMLVHTGKKLAEIKGVDLQGLFNQTRQNACELFGISL